ncbi:MAG: hypothetical protein H7Y17_03655 [Chlorobia bacterium]|nr:hypothetical protein [Fimbriimonadaceae bacterium]
MEGNGPFVTKMTIGPGAMILGTIFLAGLVLLAVVLIRKKQMPPGLFASLLVFSLCMIIGPVAMFTVPMVDVVTKLSSGSGDSE